MRPEDHSGQRLHGLDFLRALMMSLGVVLHSAQLYLSMPIVDYYWDPARSLSMDVLLYFINTFRMPVFFLLSGFFTALLLDRRGGAAMLRNRWQRVVVPFLLFLPPLAVAMTLLRIVAAHVMATGEFGFDVALIDNPRILWDNTHNLWFLYYLMGHLCGVWLLWQVWQRLSEAQQLRLRGLATARAINSPWVFVPFCLCLAVLGALNWSGRISGKLTFVPSASVYCYFGLCFLLGWLLYLRRDDLERLAARWRRYMILATVLFVASLGTILSKGMPGDEAYLLLHTLLCLLTGFCIGLYMLGFVGLFSRYGQAYNPWTRYFSDSAYWIFIFHSIPMIMIALPLHGWSVPAEIKFLVVCSGTVVACLLTYQLFVRNGRIGEILNGRRYETAPWRG